MRWIVYGAGAVGGVVGARLQISGEQVVFVARGAHGDAMERSGLRLETPVSSVVLDIEVVTSAADAAIRGDDVVLLATKSHDTRGALHDLCAAVPDSTRIVCLQNGIDNEREALRRFPHVYAVCVMCPTGHLVPGVVEAYSWPVTGILDVGRYPFGLDDMARTLAAAFAAATFESQARPDIMRWKYAKLLTNLANALEALCGPEARRGKLATRLRDEGVACLRAAGVDFASHAEDTARRGDLLDVQPIAGRRRAGGSSWQSLHRRTGSIETEYLNGEIVLLARLHGIPTPVNALVQRLADEFARERREPGSLTERDVESMLSQE